jgi:excisionase family DNA binding protein
MTCASTESLLIFLEVCALVRVSPHTGRRWLRDGRLPQPLTLSRRRLLWRKSDVDAWLANLETREGTSRG